MRNPSQPPLTSWWSKAAATMSRVCQSAADAGHRRRWPSWAIVGTLSVALLVGCVSLVRVGRRNPAQPEAKAGLVATTGAAQEAKPTASAKSQANGTPALKISIATSPKAQQPEALQLEIAPRAEQQIEPEAKPTAVAQNTPQNSTIPIAPVLSSPPINARDKDEQEDPDISRKRQSWFFDQRAYPLKHIPAGAYQKALEQRDAMKAQQRANFASKMAANPVISFPGDALWHLMGPQPIDNSTFGANGGAPTASGRVTAIAVDPADATGNTAYIGGAAGGVWKTTDGGNTWTPLTDSQPSLAVGSITIDPNNHLTIYVGTGEENFNGDAYYGAGILKSTDGGNTWTQLGKANFAQPLTFGTGGAFIGQIAVQPGNSQIILAAVTFILNGTIGGIYRSTDGGNTWTEDAAPQGLGATSVFFESTGVGGNPPIAWMAMGNPFGEAVNGIYKSVDSGATWTKQAGGLPAANLGRITLGYASSTFGGTSTIYAAIADSSTLNNPSGNLLGLFKTTNGGTTWTTITGPAGGFCNQQCFYDMAIGVSPASANTVVLGGGAYQDNFTSLFESTDGGTTWTPGGTNPRNPPPAGDFANGATAAHVHVDEHAIVFSPSGAKLYVGNDGGIWSTITPTPGAGVSPTWVDLNIFAANELALTQFYPGVTAAVSDENYGFGGTQDNDIELFQNSTQWQNEFICGDGGFTAIDQRTPTTIWAGCNTTAGVKIKKAVYNGQFINVPTIPTPTTVPGFSVAETAITASGDVMQFIPPLAVDPSNPENVYFGTCRVWATNNGESALANSFIPLTPTWSAVSGDLSHANTGVTQCAGNQGTLGTITNLEVAHSNSSVIVAGLSNGKIWETTTGGLGGFWTEIDSATLPGRTVTAVRTKRGDATGAIVYATFSGFGACTGCGTPGHVFKTTTAGSTNTWTDISGDLPDIPVNDIIVDHESGHDALYIATDVGVFSCPNPEATPACANWTVVGDGLPNSPVLGLAMRRDSRILRAATHGRSMWQIQLTDVNPPNLAFMSSVTPATANVGAASAAVTITGANLSANTQVQFEGTTTGVTTTFVNTTQLTVTFGSALLKTGGVFRITLADPAGVDQGSGLLNGGGLPFAVMNPMLNPLSMTPSSAQTFTAVPFHLTATAAEPFVPGTVLAFYDTGNPPVLQFQLPMLLEQPTINANGTTYDLTTAITDFNKPFTYQVVPYNPPPGGDIDPLALSAVVLGAPVPFTFTVTANPGPVIQVTTNPLVLGPNALHATSSITTFTVTNLVGAALHITNVAFGGANPGNFGFVAPTLVGGQVSCNFDTTKTVTLTANNSCVFGLSYTANDTPGNANSTATLIITDDAAVNPPIPITGLIQTASAGLVVLTPVNFGAVTVGTTSTTMNATLENASGSPVNVTPPFSITGANSGDFHTVAFVSNGDGLSACPAAPFMLPAAPAPGFACDVSLTFTPSLPPGSESAQLNVTASVAVTTPTPNLTGVGIEITSISPQIVATGGPAFTLTVNGGGFASSAVVNVNGATRLTTFVNSGQLLASIPASDIATAGSLAITVTTPAPGGTTSAPKTLIVAQAEDATNDNINFATVVTPAATPFRITQDTTHTTTQLTANTTTPVDPTPAPCTPAGATLAGRARSVWFTFTPTASGRVAADTRFSTYPTILTAWTLSGSLPSGTVTFTAVPNSCASENVPGTPLESLSTFNVTASTQYFIMVTDASAAANGGTLTFSLDFQATAPANDDNATPTVIAAAPFANTINTIQATANTNGHADPALPGGCATGAASSGQANSVWYEYTPTSNGTVVADTLTSPYDTILNVTSGSPAGTQVACNNDAQAGIAQSQVSFAATSGTHYFFMVSAFLGDGGTTNFHLTFSGAAVPTSKLTPTNVAFGNQQVGTTSAVTVVQIMNNSSNGASLTITNIQNSGGFSTDFNIVAPGSGTPCNLAGQTVVTQGNSCTVGVNFKPLAGGARNTTLTFTDNEATGSATVPLTGTGTVPTSGANPPNVAFGNQQVGTTSAVTVVTLTNNSANGDPLTITNIQNSGGFSTDFNIVAPGSGTPCNLAGQTVVAQGNSCTVGVNFAPLATGPRNTTLTFTDNEATGSATVPLTGTGTQPSVTFAPTPVNFGNVTQNTTSATMNVTVTNSSANGDPLHITNTAIAGGSNTLDFNLVAPTIAGTPCPIGANPLTLAQGASCVMGITFSPSSAAAENSNFNVSDDAAGSPQSVPLNGTGIAAVLSASLSPSPVPFGNQRVNATGAAVTVTLTNTGTGSVTLAAASAVTITGTNAADFAVAAGTTCANGTVVTAPNGSCLIKLTFKPGASGARTATLNVADNATGSPQSATLNGTGIAPIGTVTPNPLPFGNQRKGTTSTAQAVTVKNTGTDTLNLATANAVVIGGANAADFANAAGSTCANSTPLAPNASCIVNITFTPSTAAAEAATLTITDDTGAVPGSAQVVNMTGTGIFPVASAAPNPLPFGNVPKNTTAGPLAVTLTNSGTDALHLAAANAVAISGANAADFAIVAATTTCNNSSAVPPTPGPGNSCVVNITFTPSTTAAEAATLTITDDASPTTQVVSLTGTGTSATVALSPSPVPFSNQRINTTSATTTVTLTNSGNASVTLSTPALSITGTNAGDFAVVGVGTTCTNGAVIAASPGPGNTCVINVTFTPPAAGARTAILNVADSANPSPQSVTLNGTGIVPTASVAPLNIPFGNQRKGTTSSGTDVTVSNTGTDTLNIASIALGGANPSQFVLGAPSSGTACSVVGATPVAPAANCKFSVKFAPTTTGAQAATVTITDDSGAVAGTQQTVTVSGAGTLPQASAAPNPLAFGNQRKGTISAALTVTLTNIGTDTLNLAAANAVAISGANAADFAIVAATTTCKNSTAVPAAPGPGNTCVVNITFTPSTTAAEAATLTFTDDSGGVAGSAQPVSLTGTGVLPQGGAAPATLPFGNQPKGITSAPLTVTLTNSGTDTLNLAVANAVAISGANAADFAVVAATTTCKNSTALSPAPGPGNTCFVNITFTPSTTAAENALLTITDDSGGVAGSTQTVSLTGTGVTATVTLAPSPANFANQRTGTTSAATTITLTNSGNAAVHLAAGTPVTFTGTNPGDFTIVAGTTTCVAGATINAAPGPGNTCVINVTFTPGATGARSATINVADDAPGSPQTDNLSGTGIFPAVSATPNPLAFGNQLVASTSAPLTITVKNVGTDTLNLAAASAVAIGGANAGDFASAAGTTCMNNAAIAVNGTCVINIQFTPAAAGARAGTVTITDDVTPAQVINLTGNGDTPASITATAGTPQATTISTAFPAALKATVKDGGGNALAGVSVTFAAPGSGASGTFNGPATVITDANGVATAPTFTANAIAGTYNVNAAAAGVAQPAIFALTNNAGPAASLTVVSGTPQTVVVGTAFATLKALVKDAGGNPVSGANVTFTATPAANGASGTFANGTNTTAMNTDNTGTASATTFTANFTNGGPYQVNATVSGVNAPAAYSLTNTANAPTITAPLVPANALAGGANFVLTVNGTNFATTSVVNFNGAAKTTTFVSSTQLTAAIGAADIATAGNVNVSVTTPAPGGGLSNVVVFTINNPVPTIATLSPSSTAAGGISFVLTVNGTNFVTGAVVNFNGGAKATTFVSATQVTATILAADIANAGLVNVTVTNPAPGGGTSTPVQFTINNSQPTGVSLSPASTLAGGVAFTLTVNGNGFVSGATISFGTTAKTTTFVSATQLTAPILATDIAKAGTVNVSVTNPQPVTGPAVVLTFTINNPVPTLTSLGQAHGPGGTAFTLTVNGTNFNSSSVVNFGTKAETTTLVSTTQVTVAIPATDVSTAGPVNVSVVNPAPGGGTSTSISFTVDGYALAGPASAVTVKAGLTATIPITVTPTANGFPNQVTFSATGLPPHAALTPVTATPGNAVSTVNLMITTTANGSAPPVPLSRPLPPLVRMLIVSWIAVLLAGIYILRFVRRAPRLRRYAALVPLALLLISGGVLAGCANMSGTPKGTYQLTISASSGSMTQSTQATLTVQ